MDYDSYPIDGFSFETGADIINLPGNHAIGMFVVFGKSLVATDTQKDHRPYNDVVIANQFASCI